MLVEHVLIHRSRVRFFLDIFVKDLLHRASIHDESKLREPEFSELSGNFQRLHESSVADPSYEAGKLAVAKALQHHYAVNRHHPEHFERGIRDMNLLDLLEMFADWKASSENQNDGNLRKSIEVGARKFSFPPELTEIFKNTMEVIE